MRIAFFATDPSARHVAMLAAKLLEPETPIPIVHEAAGRFDETLRLLDHVKHERPVVVLAPAVWLSRLALRSRIDLPVLVAEAGRQGSSDAETRVGAGFGTSDTAVVPTWILSSCASRTGSRVLPCLLPPIRADEALSLASGRLPGSLVRSGVALAAAIRVAALDPDAEAITQARITDLLADPGNARERDLFEALIDLASLLDDAPSAPPLPAPHPRRCPRRHALSVRPRGTSAVLAAQARVGRL